MTCARFAVGAVALGATVALALQDVIKECCTRAHAQTQTASPEPTVWDHNGSVMCLVANGSSREIYYQKPRSGMLEAGARPGSLLFRGEVNNGQYLGTAYIFNPHCEPIPYEVKGAILNDDERIVLTGQAPRVGRDCAVEVLGRLGCARPADPGVRIIAGTSCNLMQEIANHRGHRAGAV